VIDNKYNYEKFLFEIMDLIKLVKMTYILQIKFLLKLSIILLHNISFYLISMDFNSIQVDDTHL
jgi:hypothetical protein